MSDMELYDLTVCVVAVDENAGTRQHYRLLAKSYTSCKALFSSLLTLDQYRAAMNKTALSIAQIEHPIRTGQPTMFAGRGGRELAFQRSTLESMGMIPLI